MEDGETLIFSKIISADMFLSTLVRFYGMRSLLLLFITCTIYLFHSGNRRVCQHMRIFNLKIIPIPKVIKARIFRLLTEKQSQLWKGKLWLSKN